MAASKEKITIPRLQKLKQSGQRITMLTAYDYPTALMLDQSGVDILLVGDSLAMVVQGHENTLPVTLDEMIYHGRMVGRAVQRALLVVDLPFPENHLGTHQVIASAGRILKETRAQAVKLEGGADQAGVISALVSAGIPVMAHVGLRPQAVHVMGGYKIQRDEQQLLDDAMAAQNAGAFAVVLECIPSTIAAKVTQHVSIPTIGIGAGPDCDGQVLVINDLLGLTTGYIPKFVKPYADIGTTIRHSVTSWCNDVRNREFPGKEQSFE
jgi:3-methyl-2-oxobutanoate hydroxymethyltransferase